jgi:hypothetical protein
LGWKECEPKSLDDHIYQGTSSTENQGFPFTPKGVYFYFYIIFITFFHPAVWTLVGEVRSPAKVGSTGGAGRLAVGPRDGTVAGNSAGVAASRGGTTWLAAGVEDGASTVRGTWFSTGSCNTNATLSVNEIKLKINAVRREGVDRFTGLPLWIEWGWIEGYLPFILPLDSADDFCLSRNLRWDTNLSQ